MAYGFQWMIIFLPTLMILSAISSEYLGLQEGEKILFFHHCFRHCHSFMQLFYWNYLGIMRKRD